MSPKLESPSRTRRNSQKLAKTCRLDLRAFVTLGNKNNRLSSAPNLARSSFTSLEMFVIKQGRLFKASSIPSHPHRRQRNLQSRFLPWRRTYPHQGYIRLLCRPLRRRLFRQWKLQPFRLCCYLEYIDSGSSLPRDSHPIPR